MGIWVFTRLTGVGSQANTGFYRVYNNFFFLNPNRIIYGSPGVPVQLRIRIGYENTGSNMNMRLVEWSPHLVAEEDWRGRYDCYGIAHRPQVKLSGSFRLFFGWIFLINSSQCFTILSLSHISCFFSGLNSL